MINPQKIEGLVRGVLDAIPPEMGQAPQALKEKMKANLQHALADLDLVTREEFEVQKAVLQKTRAKLEAIEQQLAAQNVSADSQSTQDSQD